MGRGPKCPCSRTGSLMICDTLICNSQRRQKADIVATLSPWIARTRADELMRARRDVAAASLMARIEAAIYVW